MTEKNEQKTNDVIFEQHDVEPKPMNECPENDANFLSRLTFWWLNGLMRTGYKKPLEITDIPKLRPAEVSTTISDEFHAKWNEELQREKPSLVRALHRTFGFRFYMIGFVKLIYDICQLSSPILLKKIIEYISDLNYPTYYGYLYALGLFLTEFISLITIHQYFHVVMTSGMRLRTGLITAVYKKSLRLSNGARQKMASGEIINLMSIDCQKMCDLLTYLHTVWSSVLQMIVSTVFLIVLIGWSAFAGMIVMILIVPFQILVARIIQRLRSVMLRYTGQRIKIINEILQGIRVIKFYAWEDSFLSKVFKARDDEVAKIKQTTITSALSSSVTGLAPVAVTLVTFTVYTLLGNELDPVLIFPALSYFNLLRFPMMALPNIVSGLAEANVSVKRLQRFLLADELDERQKGCDFENPIKITDGEFTWDALDEKFTGLNDPPKKKKKKKVDERYAILDESSSPQIEKSLPENEIDQPVEPKTQKSHLRNINLNVKKGSLTCIVGPVGSGKSSLLAAIIGEMKQIRGETTISGSIAYCSQQAWIQNATVRQNITFGLDFDLEKYNQAIEVCALINDLKILPAHDLTEIGEKGINLSGGQKQRINLARAVYCDADTYLLDDPLSAVDAHVGKHIFEKCITGVLKNKTVVLVTHQLEYLKYADHVIVMDDGEIVEQGTFKELMDKEGKFAELIATFTETEEESEQEKETKESKYDNSKELEELQQKVKEAKKSGKLMETEERNVGDVKLSVYRDYIKYAGGWFYLLLILSFFVLTEALSVGNTFWLAFWSGDDPQNPTLSRTNYLLIYLAFGVATGLCNLTRNVSFALFCLRAALNLHTKSISKVIRAPMIFFDTTPVGRILNRFSKDTESTDTTLISTLNSFIQCLTSVVSVIIVVSIITPLFLIPLVPILIIYYLVQQYYRRTSREIKRLDSIYRSPLFAHFAETLTGLSTVRAYGEQERFIKTNEEKLDINTACYFAQLCAQRWLGVRLEFLGLSIGFFAALFAVVSRSYVAAGMAGMSLTYATRISGIFNWTVRMATETETKFNSVERVLHYCDNIDQEAPAIIESNRPEDDWPNEGNIEYKNVVMRYRKELDPVLNDFNVEIRGSEKVGIVGRTGAGKSSLMIALFRLVELDSGSIIIDGVDISKIGLKDLRSRIAIIPQDPVMFSGTVRFNLDPFNQYDDHELWTALERAHMKSVVENLPKQLDSEVAEYGENFSVGQRQLFCVARAILRKTKILVMDEATASVDLNTDSIIQQTVREAFKDLTVLTIAHRLNTIIDYDKVMVLEKGKIVEFDEPKNLVINEQSLFTKLIEETGSANASHLKSIALGKKQIFKREEEKKEEEKEEEEKEEEE